MKVLKMKSDCMPVNFFLGDHTTTLILCFINLYFLMLDIFPHFLICHLPFYNLILLQNIEGNDNALTVCP